MMKKVLFENNDIRISFYDRGNDIVIISFSPMNYPGKNNNSTWGENLILKVPFSWISIESLKSHWYPVRVLNEVAEFILRVALNFKYRVGYGYSMGGYAVLKYANLLNLTHLLALAPQYSINPKVVGGFNNRYEKNFSEELHLSMEIEACDYAAVRSYIIYDNKFRPDRGHVDLICKNGYPTIISIDYIRHDVVQIFSSSSEFVYVIMRAVFDLGNGLHVFFAAQRRNNLTWLEHFFYALLIRKHAKLAKPLMYSYMDIACKNKKIAILFLRLLLATRDREFLQRLIASLKNEELNDFEQRILNNSVLLLNKD